MLLRIVFFAIMLFSCGCAIVTPFDQHTIPKPKHSIRLTTYNVYWENHSTEKNNPNSITHVLREISPDIILLQETYFFNEKGLQHQFKHSHPYQLFRNFDQNSKEDGLGILSKYPIIKNIYFPPKYGWFPGWIYILKTPYGYIQILNVHLHPKLVSDNNIGIFGEGLWLTPKFRLEEIIYYYQFLDPTLPTIIAGDFNENDRGVAVTYLRNHCYKDLLLALPPCVKTWHTQFGFLNLTGRYDRIYTSCGVQPLGCQVLPKGYSDHFPVIADFTLPRKQVHQR